jgi:protoporphyrinogen oxidase
MPILVVGGGLTGLAAAWELERLGADYTLIEVKARLGGSIATHREGGFILDDGAFLLEKYGEWGFLDELNLRDALEPAGRYRDGELVYFCDGTQMLVDALSARIRGTVMLRMAVSSIAALPGGGFGVCLENGLLLEAPAAILAVPARYAERMIRSMLPDAAHYLSTFEYDPVARVSLGYRVGDMKETVQPPEGGLFRFWESYAFPSRVPSGHVLLRAGVRLNHDPTIRTPQQALAAVRALLPGISPVLERVSYWAEDFPLTRALPEHQREMAQIDAALPAGLALVGSDYRVKRLDLQIEEGRAAARAVVKAGLQG